MPTFIEKLQNTSVAEGHPVRLECRVSGVPYPQIFWKRENESLTQNTDRIRWVIVALPRLNALVYNSNHNGPFISQHAPGQLWLPVHDHPTSSKGRCWLVHSVGQE